MLKGKSRVECRLPQWNADSSGMQTSSPDSAIYAHFRRSDLNANVTAVKESRPRQIFCR